MDLSDADEATKDLKHQLASTLTGNTPTMNAWRTSFAFVWV